MLPAFPKIEDLRSKLNRQTIDRLAAQLSPMLSEIDKHVQFEGDQTTIVRHDDTIGQSTLNAVSAEVRISRIPLIEFDIENLRKQLRDLAEQIAKGASANFFAEMDRSTAEVGNVVDGRGQPMSEELLLQMLEKMDHVFESDGTWKPPTLIASPATVYQFLKRAKADDSRLARFEQSLKTILEKKRDDFRRREADRVLAG